MANKLFNKLHAEMAEDGYMLVYLPANQAYMVTFGSYEGPRIIGPCPLTRVDDWWAEMNMVEALRQEPCHE